jgi:hypothetical protein
LFLRERIDMLKDQEKNLLKNLNWAINLEQAEFNPKNIEQNKKLDDIKYQVSMSYEICL